uniref:Receptor ligand binding region domain-containing protein n=1 Tax=Romanomermis culicivorax TaxID=13658 RepID=A0A915HY34_ROMCU
MNITNYIVIATFTRQFVLLLIIYSIINSGSGGWAEETCKGQKFSQKSSAAVAGNGTAAQRIYICLAVPHCKNVSRYVEAAMQHDKETHPVVRTFDVGYYKDCDLIWPVFDECYNRFKSETANQSSNIGNISLILAGPWCDEIPRARRAVHRLKFDNKHNVIFLTASLNVAAPRYGVQAGSSASDHVDYPLTVLLYGLERRYGQLLYYLLSEHFKWKRYVMVNLLSTQKRMENSYCDDMFTYVRLLAAKVGHVMTELYTYRIPAKARTLDDEVEYLRQFWRQLTANNRVIVVCGSIERVVRMIEKMAPVVGAKYGVILVKGSFGESDRFVRHLLSRREFRFEPCHSLCKSDEENQDIDEVTICENGDFLFFTTILYP